jgi:hypothetical protein
MDIALEQPSGDRNHRNALEARGNWQAHQAVQKSVRRNMMSDYVAFKIDLHRVALRKNSLDDLQFVRVNYYGLKSKGNALMFKGAINNMKILSEGGTLPARGGAPSGGAVGPCRCPRGGPGAPGVSGGA